MDEEGSESGGAEAEDGDDDGDEEEEEPQQLHLLGEELERDDDNAALIFVFPRDKSVKGTVESEARIEKPHDACARIFRRQHNRRSAKFFDDEFAFFHEAQSKKMKVTAAEYQGVIRRKFLEMLTRWGLRLSTFESLDGDEIFLRVSLNRQGHVIRRLAEQYKVELPVRRSVYKDVDDYPTTNFRAGQPMKNNWGIEAMLYCRYKEGLRGKLRHFRQVDEIRILETRLFRWVNVEEMVAQNIICKYFPAASYEQVKWFHEEWSGFGSFLKHPCREPTYMPITRVRDYFGEEITFFFCFFRYYHLSLLPLALLGLLLQLSLQLGQKSRAEERVWNAWFCPVLVLWASLFSKMVQREMPRGAQIWGMRDFRRVEVDDSEYNRALRGTWGLFIKQVLAFGTVIAFCSLFAFGIGVLQKLATTVEERKSNTNTKVYSYLLVITIKVFSYAWTYVAFFIAQRMNYKTLTQWNEGMIKVLAPVKLFVALWPFLETAFLKNFRSICRDDISAVAREIWPNETDALNEKVLKILSKNFTVLTLPSEAEGKICVHGCYPSSPSALLYDPPDDTTNCYERLQQDLVVYYCSHVGFTILFLAIPIFRMRMDIAMEKADRTQPYTLLQYQAKCPPYIFKSWGGSYVEDYLELAIQFALLTCFGQVFPAMTFVAFFATIMEYKLLAYRMTHVTRRPMPRGAENLGLWLDIFEMISICALIVNVALVVFVMRASEAGPHQGLFQFIRWEHALISLHFVVKALISDTPDDVVRVDEYNEHVRGMLESPQPIEVPEDERYDYSPVDVGLHPHSAIRPEPLSPSRPKRRSSVVRRDPSGGSFGSSREGTLPGGARAWRA